MKKYLLGLLKPDYSFSALPEIEVAWLLLHGFRNIILDVNNTLLSRDDVTIPPLQLQWLEKVVAAGISVVLLSNSGGRRLDMVEEVSCLKAVRRSAKPLPPAFSRAMKLLEKENSYFGFCSGSCSDCSDCSGCSQCIMQENPKKSVVVIGDQLFTDVLGAHFYGIPAIKVLPLSEKEGLWAGMMRKLERKIENRYD